MDLGSNATGPGRPIDASEVIEIVRQSNCLKPRGGGTKTALWGTGQRLAALDMSGLSGMIEYEPSEFVFTALAGTPVREIDAILAENRQYLPFDPLWVNAGATLGGTVAANSAGPGRYHYGGVRDFLVGVRLVDGEGHLVQGGGRVVKNSAGFDLPKLMVGSFGALGVMVMLSFKVFPRAQASATLCSHQPDLKMALDVVGQAGNSHLDVDALDFAPDSDGWKVWARLGGLEKGLTARLDRLSMVMGGGEILQGDEEAETWRQMRETTWRPEGWSLVKVPVTPGRIPALETALAGLNARRRYMAGGQAAWVAVEDTSPLDVVLSEHGLTGNVLVCDDAGLGSKVRLGAHPENPFYRRVKQALDPAGRLGDV